MTDNALSVVVPVDGCAGVLVALHDQLVCVLERLVPSFEIVLVDDREPNSSWTVMRELFDLDSRVVACPFSRNDGQQLAITAGIEQCRGAYAVVMECDLQDSPKAAPLLLDAPQGATMVSAHRKSDHQSAARLLGSRLYFRALSRIVARFDGELGSFRLISRRVMDAFLRLHEQSRYLMILFTIGFEVCANEHERATRQSGESGYSFRKLLPLAISGLMFSTTQVVLRWVIYAGLAMATSGLLFALLLVTHWMLFTALQGGTSLIVAQLLVGGILALCIGSAGMYVGRIFEEVRRRPLYFVPDRICQMDAEQVGGPTRDGRLSGLPAANWEPPLIAQDQSPT